jgi:hypothetical protein
MGLDRNGLKFLSFAKENGVDFSRTACLGRQGLHLSLDEFNAYQQTHFGKTVWKEKPSWSGPVLEKLGADTLHIYDASDYEGAEHIYDFNTPIPPKLHQSYSCFLEAGSWEHIFDVKQNLENSMNMVAVGGHIVAIVPANNYFGHGFYTFSPDLFFECFSESFGYELEHILVFEDCIEDTWWRLRAPREINNRVTLASHAPVYILAIAQRTSSEEVCLKNIQQSDYTTIWDGKDLSSTTSAKPASSVLKTIRPYITKLIPKSVKQKIYRVRYGAMYNPGCMKPL